MSEEEKKESKSVSRTDSNEDDNDNESSSSSSSSKQEEEVVKPTTPKHETHHEKEVSARAKTSPHANDDHLLTHQQQMALPSSVITQTYKPSALDAYEAYLAIALADGRITEDEMEAVDILRAKLKITDEQHLKVLKKLSWTPEEYSKAKETVSKQYITYLQAIMADGVISTKERQLLEELQEKYHITGKMHHHALKVLGYSTGDFHRALKAGEVHIGDDKFGELRKGKVQVYDDTDLYETGEYCRGFIELPRLRQWFELDTTSGERVLMREPHERAASSTELFFDLIFVTVIAQLSHFLAGSVSEIWQFVILYSALWRIWIGALSYSSRFYVEDLIHKIYLFLQMFGVVLMGVTVTDATRFGGSRSFAVAYIIAEVPTTAMYMYALVAEKRTKNPILYIVPLAISIGPWIASVAIGKYYYWLWGSAIIFQELVFPLTAIFSLFLKGFTFRAPMNIEHWVERMGLFIIIVLGESIFSLITDKYNTETVIDVQVFLVAAMDLLITFSLKWIYFEVQGHSKEQHALQRNTYTAVLWTFFHWPLTIAITACAAGQLNVNNLIYAQPLTDPSNSTDIHKRFIEASGGSSTTSDTTLPTSGQWLFCGSLTAALVIMGIIGLLSEEHNYHLVKFWIRFVVRLVVAIGISLIPLLKIRPFFFLLFITLLMVSLAMFEMVGLLPNKNHYYGTFTEHDDAPVDDSNDEEMTTMTWKKFREKKKSQGTIVIGTYAENGTFKAAEEFSPRDFARVKRNKEAHRPTIGRKQGTLIMT